jgi:O-antigen/teichoic acid export membrane protein
MSNGSSVVRNVKWSAVSLIGRDGARLAFALVLASWLGPENFGIMSQGTLYVALTMLFLDQGFGVALIQKKTLTDEDKGTVFLVNLAAAITVAGLTQLFAPAIAAFFHTPELEGVLRVLSITVLLKGMLVVPQALALRGMRFRALAIVEVMAALLGGLAGIAAAASGAEYWSFVVQALVLDGVVLCGLLTIVGPPRLRGSMRSFRSMRSFSAYAMGFQFLSYSMRNGDNVLVGKFLGTVALAHYSLAYRVLMLPIQSLAQVVSRVALPTFSRLQDDLPRLRHHYLAASRSVALAAFPLMTVVIVVAPLAVPFFMGADWEPAVVPMQILAIAGMRMSVMTFAGSLMLARGRSDLQFRAGVIQFVILFACVGVGLNWGVVGVAAGYTIGMTIGAPFTVVPANKIVELPRLAYWRNLLPCAGATVLGGATGFATSQLLEGAGAHPLPTMLVAAAAVVAGYGAAMAWLARPQLIEMHSLLRRRHAAVPTPVPVAE